MEDGVTETRRKKEVLAGWHVVLTNKIPHAGIYYHYCLMLLLPALCFMVVLHTE